ncbi:uncharacterized protein BX663DRAFT_516837 [Cokeromyces recurvatus]|uniref:uncharacterized protein n=1 Tax=Cokeromyces recurvatus TaxID=90255 RepID=UPI00221FDCD5|nr:uncharacterized protein BX663DRAFT_516837 [Cokeromyces recurvatus]KAI7900549.1 hypothetical protein BX663DRAFT_516837 [Cokeromyces recurvatus]
MNTVFHYNNKTTTNTTKEEYYDKDILIDYQPNIKRRRQRLSSNNKGKLFMTNDSIIDYNNVIYKLEYDIDTGLIKRPSCYYDESTNETHYHIPITMSVIRSVILKQHCKINKQDELEWFEDGLKWLSEQHSIKDDDENQYKYCIEFDNNEKKKSIVTKEESLQNFERACEAYFGIPLNLCEDHWAAKYLLSQATKGKWLRRMILVKGLSLKKLKFRIIKKWFCFSC